MKYEILKDDKIEYKGRTLYRIKALEKQIGINVGDKGGYIENYDNLSQKGKCWVHKNAKVFDNAKVFGNAIIYSRGEVYENASVYGNAKIKNDAKIYGNASVYGNAHIWGHCEIYGNAKIFGNSDILGLPTYIDNISSSKMCIYDDVTVCVNFRIDTLDAIYGKEEIKTYKDLDRIFFKNIKYELLEDTAIQFDDFTLYRIKATKDFGDIKKGTIGGYICDYINLSPFVSDSCWVYDNAKVYGYSEITDNAKVYDDSIVVNSYIGDNVLIKNNSKIIGCSLSNNVKIFDKSYIQFSTLSENIQCHNNTKIKNSNLIGNISFNNINIESSKIDEDYILKSNLKECFSNINHCENKENTFFYIKDNSFQKIEFVKADETNREILYNLKVKDEQKKHIETVYDCIQESYIYQCWQPIGIKINNVYIGFAMYGLWINEGKNGRVWLDRFLIDEKYQNLGYAKMVLPLLIEKIKDEYNYKKLYLSVYEDNHIAINFYKKLEFNFNGEKDINGELVMVKIHKED